jgi:hypothetical protein
LPSTLRLFLPPKFPSMRIRIAVLDSLLADGPGSALVFLKENSIRPGMVYSSLFRGVNCVK